MFRHDLKLPIREQNSNKGTFGKVLNVSGSKKYFGAAYLSTLSTLKMGAGYVGLVSDRAVLDSVSQMIPDAVLLTYNEGLRNFKNYTVLLIGCGLGNNFYAKNKFKKFIKKAVKDNIPTIIDADGLNILSCLNIDLPNNLIITPHPIEAARLLDTDPESVLLNLEDSAKNLSNKYNCITVLKTHRTIVCSREGEIYINKHGNSALAKAGTGDVLAGIIAGLVSQKMELFEAAKTGVYIHSRAGEIASAELTQYSLLASELPKYIPYAIKDLL